MKGGAFKFVASTFKLSKLHANTHLYTSDELVNNFPGRIFGVGEMVKPDKKLHEKFPGGKANIVLRNYPATVEDLKKKTGLTDGGDLYLVGCTSENERVMFIATRLK